MLIKMENSNSLEPMIEKESTFSGISSTTNSHNFNSHIVSKEEASLESNKNLNINYSHIKNLSDVNFRDFTTTTTMNDQDAIKIDDRVNEQEPIEVYHSPSRRKCEGQVNSNLKRSHSLTQLDSLFCSKKIILENDDLNQNQKIINENEHSSKMHQEKNNDSNLNIEKLLITENVGQSSVEKENEERKKLLVEEETNVDNLKADKEKIRRRRSSFGRYLKPIANDTSQKLQANSEITGISTIEKSETHKNDCKTLVNDIQKESLQEKEKMLINKYGKMSKKLAAEYQSWKRLRQLRKQEVLEAQRKLSEAQANETLIEEDYIQTYLTEDQKEVLASRPDYSHYLEKLQDGSERLTLTQQQIEKTTITYKAFLKICKIASKTHYEIIEEKVLGELKNEDPKILLKSLIKG